MAWHIHICYSQRPRADEVDAAVPLHVRERAHPPDAPPGDDWAPELRVHRDKVVGGLRRGRPRLEDCRVPVLLVVL